MHYSRWCMLGRRGRSAASHFLKENLKEVVNKVIIIIIFKLLLFSFFSRFFVLTQFLWYNICIVWLWFPTTLPFFHIIKEQTMFIWWSCAVVEMLRSFEKLTLIFSYYLEFPSLNYLSNQYLFTLHKALTIVLRIIMFFNKETITWG